MNEIFAIAGSTWRNVLRLKVVYFLVFCVWVLVACALNYDVLSLGLEKELLSLTFEIPKELKDGVASSMLSKPLGRTHYLIGKMLGNMVIGFVLCALVAAGSFLIFRVSFNDTVGQTMLQSQVLVILSVIPMSALAVLFAVALPEIVAPIVTVLVIWFSHSMGLLSNLPVIYGGILPDLELFNFKASAVYQTVIPWSYVVLVTLWGICYAVFAASLASLIFSRKDIR